MVGKGEGRWVSVVCGASNVLYVCKLRNVDVLERSFFVRKFIRKCGDDG